MEAATDLRCSIFGLYCRPGSSSFLLYVVIVFHCLYLAGGDNLGALDNVACHIKSYFVSQRTANSLFVSFLIFYADSLTAKHFPFPYTWFSVMHDCMIYEVRDIMSVHIL